MELYFLFAMFVFVTMVFDNWLDGANLYKSDAFLMVIFAVIPFVNILFLIIALFRILNKIVPNVILKGKR